MERIHTEAPGLVAVLPIEDRGRHELIRLGAALARHLPGATGSPVLNAAHALGITVPEVEKIEEVQPDEGILALIEGRHVAFGRETFVSRVAQHPHLAEREAGHRIEAQNGVAFYVVVLDSKHCVGLLGIATPDEG
jgi:cation transport ATPase